MSMQHWPETERPREKLLRLGAASLSEAELLAILLQTGTRGHSALDMARTLLGTFRSLRGLLTAERGAVCGVRGLGAAKYALLQASLELARRHYAELMQTGPALANPRATREFLRARLRDRDHEVFCCLFLDNRHRVICFDPQRRGGDPGPQPPFRGGRAQPGGRADHRPAARGAGAGGHPGARPHRGRGRGLRVVRGAGAAVREPPDLPAGAIAGIKRGSFMPRRRPRPPGQRIQRCPRSVRSPARSR